LLVLLSACLCLPALLSAEQSTLFQKQAELYRKRGFEFQKQGRLDTAIVYYQKAINMDPSYVVAYNDLGILYEAKGWPNKAEEIYLAGLRVDPNYLNLYSNLAMFYERSQDYTPAIYFWKRRIELSDPQDSWAEKARERLWALSEFDPALKQELFQQEAARLNQEIEKKRQVKRSKELAEAAKLTAEAKKLFRRKEYDKALNNINIALLLNPEEKNALLDMRDEITLKLKEREKKARIAEMETHFKDAMNYYQQDNFPEAKYEIDKIATTITSSKP
jgi:tetratricopeptide (TPR) repeat protein